MLGQHVRHALARAFAPHGDDDALACSLQRLDVLSHRIEDVGVGLASFGHEVMAGVGADLDHVRHVLGRVERRQAGKCGVVEAFAPFGFGKVEPIRRQRFVWRAAARLVDRVLARLIVVGDLRQPLVRGFFGERLDRDRAFFQVIEQRLEPGVKQRQPMLDAGGAAALGDRFVEHVVGASRAEGRDIAGAEQPDGVGGELELRHRHEIERAQLIGGALGVRIEAADRFQRVAEEIEPHRRVHARREQIDNAAAHRIVARLAHGRCTIKAVEFEPLDDARHRQQIARRGGERLAGQRLARRHPLQHGVHGGEHDRRLVAAVDAGEPRQRHHPLRHHVRMRRSAVVGQAIPRRKFQPLDIGREEAERARQRRHARAVAADHDEADRGRGWPGRNGAREVGQHQPFGAVGDAGKQERAAGMQPLRRRTRGSAHLHRHGFSSAPVFLV